MGNRYIALVRGPSSVFPRGSLWVIPVWYAVIAGQVYSAARLPSWYLPVALGGMLAVAVTLLIVLGTMRNNAFAADEGGITLGLRGGGQRRLGRRRRKQRHLDWNQIEQLRVTRRYYGARIEMTLSPAAQVADGPVALLGRLAGAVLLLILPVTYVFRAPGLAFAGSSSLRYRIQLCDVDGAELTSLLSMLAAPAGAAVTLTRRWRTGRPARIQPAAWVPQGVTGTAVPAGGLVTAGSPAVASSPAVADSPAPAGASFPAISTPPFAGATPIAATAPAMTTAPAVSTGTAVTAAPAAELASAEMIP